MAGLKAHLEKLKAYTPERVADDLMAILQEQEETVTNMVTDQLFQGKDSENKDLPEYSPVSVGAFGKRPGPWQLFETGDFYRGIVFQTTKEKGIFESTDGKTPQIFEHLEAKGGNSDTLLGLNSENRKELAQEYLKEKTVAYFRQILAV